MIAHTLAQKVGPEGEVHSLDIGDERVETEGYNFQQVTDPHLPFPDKTFDIVLSNHVIEHVGDTPEQRVHVAEIHRVLKDDGLLYLATATRWLVIEPHYRLPFLSWFPRPVAGSTSAPRTGARSTTATCRATAGCGRHSRRRGSAGRSPSSKRCA